ncbi:MAG: LLM class flavin-dependent oxidoreductase [Acidimicrobiales bacterium]
MSACGVPLAGRGERSDEYLAAMRTLWSGDAVSFDGEYVSFESVTANPKPVQESIHTVVGGHSDRARRRAIELAHGWYGFMRDPATAADDIAALRRLADTVERPSELGRLEISITPRTRLTPEDLEAYADLGVDRLILQPGGHRGGDELAAFVDANAPSNW